LFPKATKTFVDIKEKFFAVEDNKTPPSRSHEGISLRWKSDEENLKLREN
jgi:hypothetical protein